MIRLLFLTDYTIVEMECFQSKESIYIVKELFIMRPGITSQYLFRPPYPKKEIPANMRAVQKYCTKKLHGFKWEDGATDYKYLHPILKFRCESAKLILTKGSEKIKFLENILERSVFDLDEVLFKRLDQIQTGTEFSTDCWYDHENFRCAKKNAYKIYEWFEKVLLMMNHFVKHQIKN